PSHRLLDDGPTDLSQAEEFLSGRLRNSRDLHDVQGILQMLLQDPKVAEKLLRDLPPQYRDEIQRRAGALNLDDPKLGKLLDNAIKMPSVSDQQKGLLEDLRKQLPSVDPSQKNPFAPDINPFNSNPATPPEPSPEGRPSIRSGPTPPVE